MENKINIAEILRDMPKGTKLYSPLFGKCELVDVCTDGYGDFIRIEHDPHDANKKVYKSFSSNGRYFGFLKDTECLLFPSAKMRCWDKFFKRGDVVYNPDGEMFAIFEGWVSDDCTEFNTKLNLCKINNIWSKKGKVCFTECFSKATDEEKAKFIAAAEKHYGGKYNPETLQVEPVGVVESKRSFEPFQKVLVRDDECDTWKADYFSNYEKGDKTYRYNCVGSFYKSCIPYEGNEHLLGTDKPFLQS